MLKRLRRKASPAALVAVGAAALLIAFLGIRSQLDPAALTRSWERIRQAPEGLAVVLAVYGTSFAVRAGLWRRVLPSLSFGHSLAGIHLGLAANHLLPLRLGEAGRIVSVVRRARVPLSAATASTASLRAADLLALMGIIAVVGPGLITDRVFVAFVLLATTLLVVFGAGLVWIKAIRAAGRAELNLPGPLVAGGCMLAWVLESVVVWQATRWAGIPVEFREALLVTCVAVLSQVVAVAPGGFGTYEAAAAGALVAFGAPAGPAVAAALVTHVVKTLYSLGAGGVALFFPAPGLLGRFRIPRARPPAPCPPAPAQQKILLFLPARNEEPNIAAVIERLPAEVLGCPTHCLVVDDGSTDDTAAVARSTGAEVISWPEGQGLGAGVRLGLAEGAARRAAVIAFCDADGEYDPAELDRLAGPILAGNADYVVGSRFAGGSCKMKRHRNVGNRALSVMVSAMCRRRISDGQSGYRAFSLSAASAAEVIHDYNYAQVLTLDLLAKGLRYQEVPISYAHRSQGRSFVKLIPYLKAVLPAIYRELNSPDGASSKIPASPEGAAPAIKA
ncbi:MAG: lysylphosphatidylglycerol synthase domain-containing protein [Actinomycetota bacterium]